MTQYNNYLSQAHTQYCALHVVLVLQTMRTRSINAPAAVTWVIQSLSHQYNIKAYQATEIAYTHIIIDTHTLYEHVYMRLISHSISFIAQNKANKNRHTDHKLVSSLSVLSAES